MTILVTGAPGFVGRALIDELLANSDYKIFAAVRKLVSNFPSVVEQWKFDGISATTDWNYALQGIDCIIHTAARVHIMSDTANDPREEFREINNFAPTCHMWQQVKKPKQFN